MKAAARSPASLALSTPSVASSVRRSPVVAARPIIDRVVSVTPPSTSGDCGMGRQRRDRGRLAGALLAGDVHELLRGRRLTPSRRRRGPPLAARAARAPRGRAPPRGRSPPEAMPRPRRAAGGGRRRRRAVPCARGRGPACGACQPRTTPSSAFGLPARAPGDPVAGRARARGRRPHEQRRRLRRVHRGEAADSWRTTSSSEADRRSCSTFSVPSVARSPEPLASGASGADGASATGNRQRSRGDVRLRPRRRRPRRARDPRDRRQSRGARPHSGASRRRQPAPARDGRCDARDERAGVLAGARAPRRRRRRPRAAVFVLDPVAVLGQVGALVGVVVDPVAVLVVRPRRPADGEDAAKDRHADGIVEPDLGPRDDERVVVVPERDAVVEREERRRERGRRRVGEGCDGSGGQRPVRRDLPGLAVAPVERREDRLGAQTEPPLPRERLRRTSGPPRRRTAGRRGSASPRRAATREGWCGPRTRRSRAPTPGRACRPPAG